MFKKLLKLWKDPVWSKVIAASIIAISTVIWTLISAKINDTNFQTA
ncbi:MAG: hypothetical protein NTW25_02115 [Candidatus Kapabacteria bacterium]|nr:hypothetical protein [Candidatus Kapabacteria bacterium]